MNKSEEKLSEYIPRLEPIDETWLGEYMLNVQLGHLISNVRMLRRLQEDSMRSYYSYSAILKKVVQP